jgi:DNA mismatch repair protein MutS2
MDAKTLQVLEYPKILERLKSFCDFSASMELARSLEPTDSYDLALARLAETTEARKLFSTNDNIGIGGAHDIRPRWTWRRAAACSTHSSCWMSSPR